MKSCGNWFGRLGFLAFLATVGSPAVASDDPPAKQARPANRLAKETSPYLLLHAHNPVDWYPWGPEAFAQGQGREQADLSFGRLQLVLLVPRHGARELHGRGDRQGA